MKGEVSPRKKNHLSWTVRVTASAGSGPLTPDYWLVDTFVPVLRAGWGTEPLFLRTPNGRPQGPSSYSVLCSLPQSWAPSPHAFCTPDRQPPSSVPMWPSSFTCTLTVSLPLVHSHKQAGGITGISTSDTEHVLMQSTFFSA